MRTPFLKSKAYASSLHILDAFLIVNPNMFIHRAYSKQINNTVLAGPNAQWKNNSPHCGFTTVEN